MPRSLRTISLVAAFFCLAMVPDAASAQEPASACALVASPSGSDSAAGTAAAPFQTAQKLVNSLQPGQTGCLQDGTYNESVTFRGPGTTLTSYPGQTATIVGRLYVAEGADGTTITGLGLDGANPGQMLSPMIDANDVTFSYDDVTNDHTGTCFGIGSATWGWATGTVITHDRVHDCGVLPATNLQHGFYIGAATDTTIEWNLIYANADRGIQLYPDALYTTIDHNIIDDNGEGIIISGEGGNASSYTNVYDNVISNAVIRHDVESYWPAGNPVGVGNLVHDNCVWGGQEGTISTTAGGFTAQGNVDVDPQFADAGAHDYEMSATSPCLALVGDVQAAVDGTSPIQPLPGAGTGAGAATNPGAGQGGVTGAATPSPVVPAPVVTSASNVAQPAAHVVPATGKRAVKKATRKKKTGKKATAKKATGKKATAKKATGKKATAKARKARKPR